MDEKTMREIATAISKGVVPATNGLMYVLIALIHKLVEKDLLSEDEVKNMLDLLADTLKRSGEACETEKAIVEKTRTFLFSERARLRE